MADLGLVGEARVEMRATSDKLNRDLKGVRNDVGKAGVAAGASFGRGFSSSASKFIGPALAGLVSVAALRRLTSGIETALGKLDNIAKTADSIGITTDALQELRVAADLSGVSAGALDAGLRKFAKGSNEASQGVAEYKDTFDRLGISVNDTSGRLKPLDTLLGEVATAFKGMKNATEKAALAQELFGRGGVPMVNLLNEGADGMERMREEARKLGLVIDEVLIRKAVIAQDKLTLIKKVIETDLTIALANLGPTLAAAGQGFNEFLAAVGRAQDKIISFSNTVTEGLALKGSQIEVRDYQAQIDIAIKKRDQLLNPKATGVRAAGGVKTAPASDAAQAEAANLELEIQRLQQEKQSAQLRLNAGRDFIRGTPGFVSPGFVPAVKQDDGGGDGGGGGGGGGGAADTSAADAAAKRTDAIKRLQEAIESQRQTEADSKAEIDATISSLGMEESAREALIDQLKVQQLEEQILRDAKAAGLELAPKEIAAIHQQIEGLQQIVALRGESQARLDTETDAIERNKQATDAMNSALQATSDELVAAAFEGGNFIEILAKLAIKLFEIQAMQALGAQGGGGGGGFLGIALNAVLGAAGSAFGGGISLSNTGNAFGSSGSLFNSSGAIALPGNAEGGKINGEGTSTSDSILSWLSDGEFVINAKATREYQPILEAINNGRKLPAFADGGMVGNFALSGDKPMQRFDDLGNIFPKADLEAALNGGSDTGGKGVTVQMNIQASDVGSFRRSQSQLSAEVGRMIRQGQSRQG